MSVLTRRGFDRDVPSVVDSDAPFGPCRVSSELGIRRGLFVPKKIDIAGKTFGRLEVLEQRPSRSKRTYWLCRCECGSEIEARTDHLKNGNTSSCGCLQRDIVSAFGTVSATHGMRHTTTYTTWLTMRARCQSPTHEHYHYYGGRGIAVTARWDIRQGGSFENFLADMGERPEGTTLDRIDPDGNYEPGNCRWATPKEQRANQRQNRRDAIREVLCPSDQT